MIVMLALLLAAAVNPTPQLSTPKHFDLSALKCHQLLDASLQDRAYVMMLYWGYEAGKTGVTAFQTSDIRAKSMKLTDQCPKTPAMPVFAAIKAIQSK